MKAPHRYIQGYNAQAVVTEDQIIIAAEITIGSSTSGTSDRWSTLPCASSKRPASPSSRGVIVADAGYWHQQQMDDVTGQGIPVLVPPDADKRKGNRPGWDGGPYAFMRAVLETELGKRSTKTTTHRRAGVREHEVQPPLRSLPTTRPCRLPLRMAPITATHNLLKLHRHQIATAGP